MTSCDIKLDQTPHIYNSEHASLSYSALSSAVDCYCLILRGRTRVPGRPHMLACHRGFSQFFCPIPATDDHFFMLNKDLSVWRISLSLFAFPSDTYGSLHLGLRAFFLSSSDDSNLSCEHKGEGLSIRFGRWV